MGIETDVTLNRERGIGGSDIPAIMGISPFTKRFDLLMYKVGIAENEFKGNVYTEYGNILEPKIRDYVNSLGYDFRPTYIEKPHEPLSRYYHSDGLDENKDTVIEIKTTSKIHNKVEEYKVYLSQLLYGMMLNKCPEGILAVYERPDDLNTEFDKSRLHLYFIGIEDYEAFEAEIWDAIGKFEVDYKYLAENPFAGESDLPSNTKISAIMDVAIDVGGKEIPASWLLQNLKALKDAEKRLRDELTKQMGEHNIKKVEFQDLGVRVSYTKGKSGSVSKKFDETRFKKEHGDLYEQYCKDVITGGKSDSIRITSMVKGEKA